MDVMTLIDSDEEDVFHDAVPRLPPLTNGHVPTPATTLVEIHCIQSSKRAPFLLKMFHVTLLSASGECHSWGNIHSLCIKVHIWSRKDVFVLYGTVTRSAQ